jgi:hypothetical protein
LLRVILLQEEVAKLFASGNNGPGCDRELFEAILLIG